MIIKNALVHSEEKIFEQRSVYIENTRFANHSDDLQVIDGSDCYLIPGLIDIHFHGCSGFDFCDATKEALQAIGAYELRNGITAICPASMTLSEENLIKICQNGAAYQRNTPDCCSTLCGINLEGPFISPKKKGAQNPSYIQLPSCDTFQHLMTASNGLIRLITLAPELEGAMDFIQRQAPEVHISLGHTECDYDTARAAFAYGADHVTHLYNAMMPFTHRAPSLIGAASDSAHVMAEIICDGIHLHPSAVRAAFRLFGEDRIILISDSMMATGMPDGAYSLGGLPVQVNGHYATLSDGTLAGSATNLMDCMKRAVSMGIPLASAVSCSTINPARSIGIDADYGSIKAGKYADCLLLDQKTLKIRSIILHGRLLTEGDFGIH